MAQWKIGGRQAVCSACETAFADGERHHSMLRIEGEALERLDGCLRCWDQGKFGPKVEAGPEVKRFFWTTRHEAAPAKTISMDMDALQRLFMELQDREERNLRELRYVLCLLLLRKRRVKLERLVRGEEGETFIVRKPKTEERYTVEVFDFTKERMAEIRQHLQAIFDGVDTDGTLAKAAAGEDDDALGDSSPEDSIADEPLTEPSAEPKNLPKTGTEA